MASGSTCPSKSTYAYFYRSHSGSGTTAATSVRSVLELCVSCDPEPYLQLLSAVVSPVPHEPLAPLWVARSIRAKYCNCNCNIMPCNCPPFSSAPYLRGWAGGLRHTCLAAQCPEQRRPPKVLRLPPVRLALRRVGQQVRQRVGRGPALTWCAASCSGLLLLAHHVVEALQHPGDGGACRRLCCPAVLHQQLVAGGHAWWVGVWAGGRSAPHHVLVGNMMHQRADGDG